MRHDWDVLNRAINILGTSTGGSYAYRADGQRVEKVEGATLLWTPTGSRGSGFYDTNYATNRPTSRYFYDGQMGFEDDYNPSGSVTTINRYGLGARGIDRIENYASSTTTYGYPLYDGHGSMRAVLTKSGSTYATGNWRTYDVWGSVRSGSATGDPKQRYVANLGHVADDESDLIYMRARYYEPGTGRFVSEDSKLNGLNWFSYCSNDPVNRTDFDGNEDDESSWGDPNAAGQGLLVNVLAAVLGPSIAARIASKVFSLATKAMLEWLDKTSGEFIRRGLGLFSFGAEMVAAASGQNGFSSAGAIAGYRLMARGVLMIAAGWFLKILKFYLFME